MRTDIAIIQAAVNWYHRRGFRCVPCHGKHPVKGVAWLPLQKRLPTVDELRQWFSESGVGIAVLTGYSGFIAVDCDSMNAATWWWKNRPRSSMMVKTKNGVHFYYRVPSGAREDDQQFRNMAKVRIGGHKRAIDIRGHGGYVLVPPSEHPDGGQYKRVGSWQGLDKIPEYDPGWFDKRENVPARARLITPRDDAERARLIGEKYISHIRAIQGQGGDKETFRAACKLIEFGLNAGLAYDVLQEWNRTNCEPPWQDRDLMRKIECAYESVKGKIA